MINNDASIITPVNHFSFLDNGKFDSGIFIKYQPVYESRFRNTSFLIKYPPGKSGLWNVHACINSFISRHCLDYLPSWIIIMPSGTLNVIMCHEGEK